MKVKELFNPPVSSAKAPPRSRSKTRLTGLILSGLAAIISTLTPTSAEAQTNMTLKPNQVRIEVPVGFNSTYWVSNCTLRIPTNGATGVDGTGTNWIIANVTASISGAPAGVTATLVNADLTPVGPIPINMNTNNGSKSTNLMVRLDFDGSEASGVSTLAIVASGAGLPDDAFFVPLEIAKIWNGASNAAVNGAGNWSDATKWLGGVPGPNDIVVFKDFGAQTNTLLSGTNQLTNSIVDTTTTIAGLRFSQTNGLGSIPTNTHNLAIAPGVTLAIKGDAGFKMLRDYVFWSPKMNISIWGTNGTLVQTNENSDFAILTDGATAANAFETLDMSRLGNLQLDVNQVNVGDIFGYPFYLQYATNGYTSGNNTGTSRPQKIQPTWNMALTNVVKAVFVDTNNYTNAFFRDYAMVIGRNDLSGGSSGNDQVVNLGATNAFFMDGICVGGFASLGASINFQNTNSVAIFRNTDGTSRMSIFTLGDGAGTVSGGASAGANTKSAVDFTKGKVDIMVDKFFMSMDRGLSSGGGGQVQSSLSFSGGTIDANTAFICYQSSGNQTSLNNCVATLNVSSNAVFNVNSNLTLGYTASDANDPSSPGTSNGKINISSGGTVTANNISVGGVTKTTGGNNISLSSGGNLIVSNNIGDTTVGGALGTLSFGGTGNNSLTLFIDGSKPLAPLVYLTNLTASGTGNKLVIGVVTNVTFPVDVPLIAGVGSGFPISPSTFDAGVQMPAGMTGILTLSSSNTINVHIINRVPHHLTWRATGDANGTATWDYTSFNWLDTDTGITTNYNNPDIVTFDDAPGHATNVMLGGGSDPLTPVSVTMTNNTLNYAFLDGGNSLLGGPSLNKYGTGNVEVDGNTTLAVQLNTGTMTGSGGSIGTADTAAGTVMNYAGTVGGSLIDSGVATISGTVSGVLTIQSGGVFTNMGTINSSFSVKTNGFIYNASGASLHNIGAGSSGSPQVAAGGTLINAGNIGAAGNGDILFVSGTFEDLATTGMTLSSVTVGSGGKFIPGGDGVGNTTINSDGTGSFPGALLIQLGSTTVFKVDPSTPTNTTVTSAHLSFGGSANAQTQNGGTLVITNINGAPFTAGQSFKLFVNAFGSALINGNTGTSTNTYPTIVPASPGPGLAWDLRHIWMPDSQGRDGVIGVVNQNSGPTFTSSYSVTATNIALQFTWDPTNQGMRLQTLVVPNTQGINSTNPWTAIAGSQTNTTVNITNNITTNNVFFRLVFP